MLTQEKLKARLSYNPETGEFRYKIGVAQMRPCDLAGRPNTNGHIQISIDHKRYMAHNLAWLYMYGVMPPVGYIIDHKDRNYSNNSWDNIRPATFSQNQGNSKINSNNISGLKGVYWNTSKKLWVAQIGVNGKRKYLGAFDCPDKAADAYDLAAKLHFGEEFALCN